MSSAGVFDAVSVGDELPSLVTRLGEVQLFSFSAATFNPHRIHYDRTWATEQEHYRDLVVQGPLQQALMVKVVTDWAGPEGRLTRVAMQSRGTAFVHDELKFTAQVTGKRVQRDLGIVELVLAVSNVTAGGVVIVPGTATLALPRGKADCRGDV